MKKLLAPLLVLSLIGCASTATEKSSLQLEHTYQVEWIGEQPLIDRSYLTLTLGADGRAYGSSGCNHWFARYDLAEQQLSFSEAGSTRKLCSPALMQQEQLFLQSLSEVVRWDFSELDQLRLWPTEGAAIRLWSVQYPGQ